MSFEAIATRLSASALEQEYRHLMETMRLATGLALPPDLQAPSTACWATPGI